MSDQPGRRGTERDPAAGPRTPGMGKPRWLAVVGGIIVIVIAIAFAALIVLLHLTGTIGPGVH